MAKKYKKDKLVPHIDEGTTSKVLADLLRKLLMKNPKDRIEFGMRCTLLGCIHTHTHTYMISLSDIQPYMFEHTLSISPALLWLSPFPEAFFTHPFITEDRMPDGK